MVIRFIYLLQDAASRSQIRTMQAWNALDGSDLDGVWDLMIGVVKEFTQYTLHNTETARTLYDFWALG